MSENDYIAEYIKERRPELINSFDYIIWKIGKIIENGLKDFNNAIYKNFKSGEDDDDRN